MGARGPVARTQGRTISREPLIEFDPPANLCTEAQLQWDAYWSDPVSRAPTTTDRGVLLRWVESVHRYIVSIRAADETPIVLGSTGQEVVNPLYKVAEMALTTIERCEKQLGIGSSNRAALGIAIASETKSLADMNRQYEEGSPRADDDSASEADDEDPRLAVVDGETGQITQRATRPKRSVS